MNILFCNIAWMTHYNGITDLDKPVNGGSWVKENGLAHESTNFKNYGGKYYGFVQTPGNINLEKYFKNASKKSEYIDDVLVVWCATSETKGNVIVGWYKHARLYRKEKSSHTLKENLYYRMEAEVSNCYLIPESEREFLIGRATKVGVGKGFGQSNVWYASADVAKQEVIPNVINYIESKLDYSKLGDGYDNILEDEIYHEGSISRVSVNRYERNTDARKKCIEKHGCQCKICGFDFEKTYGETGKGLIHVHHIIPISSIKETYQIDYESDLIPVCPNCHAMIHRKKEPYTPEEIRKMYSGKSN